MALYQDATVVTKVTDEQFDEDRNPGSAAPYSGIYRCQSCGHEVTSEEGKRLPPQYLHPHPGKIVWRLVVYAQHKE